MQSSPGKFCDRSNLLRGTLFPNDRALRDYSLRYKGHGFMDSALVLVPY